MFNFLLSSAPIRIMCVKLELCVNTYNHALHASMGQNGSVNVALVLSFVLVRASVMCVRGSRSMFSSRGPVSSFALVVTAEVAITSD